MSSRMPPNNQPVERTQDDFFAIVQISPVPVDLRLSQVLLDVSPYVRDVIGVMRVADYKAKRQGETVFLYCVNRASAQMLESIKLDYNNQYISPITVPMKAGRASFIDKNFESSFHGVPISIILKGIERQKDVTIYYLHELAKYFEKKGVVTGVRLGFNEKRNWSTSQGYVTFLRQADARSCSGEGGYIEHTIQGRKVRAALSENIPMLVSLDDLDHFKNGIINWGEEAEAINQLIMTFQWPMHLAEKQTVDNKKLLKNLQKKHKSSDMPECSTTYTIENTQETVKIPAKRAKVIEPEEPPQEANDPQVNETPAAIHTTESEANKSANAQEDRESPESPFEDIMSDTDEEVLCIDLEADISNRTFEF